MQTSKAKKGFTLIELLIVIAIIGLLATLAIVSLTTAQRKARDTKRIADVKQLQNAVELYYSEVAQYPLTDTVTAFGATTADVDTVNSWPDFGTAISSYITNVPVDPTNTTTSVYTYGANAAGDEYFIAAKLEDEAHTALNGDDDNEYIVGTTSGWTGVDFVASSDSVAGTDVTRTTMDCGTTVLDATGGIYCASE
ncbi:MAG: prepilin-type N-terminal cleavage/methylation domain-containing protein [Candidatus Kerfeldbacteria bacterium]|nr:prepilin-type N-terminal cleavage/methylation domain-containing protein [Candidatus Kerfeldbacteria bacterium]